MTVKRTDANQAEIVAALRRAGCSVQDLHIVGKGCPDILVSRQGVNFLIEIKTERGALTDDEAKWLARWRGRVAIVHSINEALQAVGLLGYRDDSKEAA